MQWTSTSRGFELRRTPRSPIALTDVSTNCRSTTRVSVRCAERSPSRRTSDGCSVSVAQMARSVRGTSTTPIGSSRERTGHWRPWPTSDTRRETPRSNPWWSRSTTGSRRRDTSSPPRPRSSRDKRTASADARPRRAWPSGTSTSSAWRTNASTTSQRAWSRSSGPTGAGTATRTRRRSAHRSRRRCGRSAASLATSMRVVMISCSGGQPTGLARSSWSAGSCGDMATAHRFALPGGPSRRTCPVGRTRANPFVSIDATWVLEEAEQVAHAAEAG